MAICTARLLTHQTKTFLRYSRVIIESVKVENRVLATSLRRDLLQKGATSARPAASDSQGNLHYQLPESMQTASLTCPVVRLARPSSLKQHMVTHTNKRRKSLWIAGYDGAHATWQYSVYVPCAGMWQDVHSEIQYATAHAHT